MHANSTELWATPFDTVKLPDSALCREAVEYVDDCNLPVLRNHALRSYVFAAAMGQLAQRTFDAELLFVACALHDIGLSDSAPVDVRFEVEGADMARAWARARGVSGVRLDQLWDAIALHTTPVIPQRKSAEVALCQTGTAIDVGVAPVSLLPPRLLEQTVARLPRLQFKRQMPKLLCGLAQRNVAALDSPPVAACFEREGTQGLQRPHFCELVAGAGFEE